MTEETRVKSWSKTRPLDLRALGRRHGDERALGEVVVAAAAVAVPREPRERLPERRAVLEGRRLEAGGARRRVEEEALRRAAALEDGRDDGEEAQGRPRAAAVGAEAAHGRVAAALRRDVEGAVVLGREREHVLPRPRRRLVVHLRRVREAEGVEVAVEGHEEDAVPALDGVGRVPVCARRRVAPRGAGARRGRGAAPRTVSKRSRNLASSRSPKARRMSWRRPSFAGPMTIRVRTT